MNIVFICIDGDPTSQPPSLQQTAPPGHICLSQAGVGDACLGADGISYRTTNFNPVLALVESAAVAKGGCSSKRHGDSETRGVTCHSRRGRHPSLPGFCATPSWAGTLARSTVTSTVARLHNLQRCAADHPATIRHPVYARYPLLPCDINLYCLCCPHHCPLAALLSQSFTFYSHFAHPCDALTSCATGPSFWNDEGVVECEPGDYFPTCKQPRAL